MSITTDAMEQYIATEIRLATARLRKQVDEQQAEIGRLKTVPMRYRRMEFNAQLQKENAELSRQLSEAQDSEEELLKALEGVVTIMILTETSVRFPYVFESAEKAIAAHKARKEQP